MKKFLLSSLIITALLFVTGGMTFAAGTAVNLGPIEALKILDNQIAALPDSAFNNTMAAAQQKKALSRQIGKVIHTVEKGAYNNIANDLQRDIRNDIFKWVNVTEQPKLLESIDNIIVSINNAAKTTITTAYGKVAGVDADFGSWVWRGIPYAKPPVGALRWKAPQDPNPWPKIRHSTHTYTPGTQAAYSALWVPEHGIKGSEDCLYLDVYRPKTNAKNLPVYFWIHGGNNVTGEAGIYNSAFLAGKSNMVVVVIQYRLGPFGWFTHPALNPSGTAEDKSGNYGTLDMIKALHWVQKNITSFGGDPKNVTVAGESAGGFDALNLMISPLAKGLFHRVIAESAGGINVPPATGVAQANATIDKLLMTDGTCVNLTKAADYRASMTNAQIEAYLRGKSAETIIQMMMDATSGSFTESISPFYDGAVIPGTLHSVFESGNYHQVPVILGSNEHEMKSFIPLFLGTIPTSGGYTWSNIYNAIGVAEPPVTLDKLMPPGGPDRALYENISKYSSLNWKASMVDSLAALLRKHQDNVYCYWFKWGGIGSGLPPFDFLIGAGHGFELPFFFGWPGDIWNASSCNETNQKGRAALQQAMMSYVSSFVISGNPNPADGLLPVWEAWSNNTGGPKSIIFNSDFTQAKIGMMNQEITKAEVMTQINALPEQERNLTRLFCWF
jgi:para-nitrobenzyl esterase